MQPSAPTRPWLSGSGPSPDMIGALPQTDSFELGFANCEEDLLAIQRLRYLVFNAELKEGFEASEISGLDQDEFDTQCMHLFVRHRDTGQMIGTYRMQTFEMAERGRGFYTDTLFDLSLAPRSVLINAVEVGRACILDGYRSLSVLYLLWKGIGHFTSHFGKRYVFGCCSIPSQDEGEGCTLAGYLMAKGHQHPILSISPHSGYECVRPQDYIEPMVKPPRLMRTYLSLGATVCSPPAIDRMFKTIDFLVLFDTAEFESAAAAFFRLRP